MNMEKSKSNGASIFAGIAIASVISFGIGVMVTDSVKQENACEISVDAKNVDGNVTAKIRASGSQDSCAAVIDELQSYTNQAAQADDSQDDSAASDADAASAPCAASQ